MAEFQAQEDALFGSGALYIPEESSRPQPHDSRSSNTAAPNDRSTENDEAIALELQREFDRAGMSQPISSNIRPVDNSTANTNRRAQGLGLVSSLLNRDRDRDYRLPPAPHTIPGLLSAPFQIPAGDCAICKRPVGGRGVSALGGQMFHIGCFRCEGCQQPIRDGMVFIPKWDNGKESISFDRSRPSSQYIGQSYELRLYHPACHRELFHPKCAVCDQPLPEETVQVAVPGSQDSADSGGSGTTATTATTTTSSRIVYVKHAYFDEKYCPYHVESSSSSSSTAVAAAAAAPSRSCFSCRRYEPTQPSRKFHRLSDGRSLCQSCCSTDIVLDSTHARTLYLGILGFMVEVLGLAVPDEMHKIPVLAVELSTLNERTEREGGAHGGHGHGSGGGSTVRGLCLSEVGHIMHFGAGAGARGLLGGHGGKSGNGGGPVHADADFFVQETRAVTAILVLFGLPAELTASILAHEAMHAWLRLGKIGGTSNGNSGGGGAGGGGCTSPTGRARQSNFGSFGWSSDEGFIPRQFPATISPMAEEGVCQLMAYLWLSYRQNIGAEADHGGGSGSGGGSGGVQGSMRSLNNSSNSAYSNSSSNSSSSSRNGSSSNERNYSSNSSGDRSKNSNRASGGNDGNSTASGTGDWRSRFAIGVVGSGGQGSGGQGGSGRDNGVVGVVSSGSGITGSNLIANGNNNNNNNSQSSSRTPTPTTAAPTITTGTDNSSLTRDLRGYFMFQIAEDSSVVYGEGFRLSRMVYDKHGLHRLLEGIRDRGDIPRHLLP